MSRRAEKEVSRDALPHPAEDLSADDDLLSWILVDQLGCLPNSKLGVHPQQVRFVGPQFKTDEVLNVIKETVVRGQLQPAMQQLQDFHLIKSHLANKTVDGQRERFIIHMRRYLLPLLPTSRIEIHTTSRYTSVTGHVELAVYATRPLSPGMVLQELQGSVVPLPDEWREEMEIGEDFALAAAEDELEESEDESDDEDADARSENESVAATRRRREVERQKGARRSDRTKRRDFSIVWSGLKRCFQLFLGPARFLNHDCSPNVELLRQGRYVTFRVTRPIRIGDELTTFYGDNYFGKANAECLCLSCEQAQRGGFTPKPAISRSRSRDSSTAPSANTPSVRNVKVKPSGLRNVLHNEDFGEEDAPEAGPSKFPNEDATIHPETPKKARYHGSHSSRMEMEKDGADDEDVGSGSDCESDTASPEPIRRAPSTRVAAQSVKPWTYLRRAPQSASVEESGASTPEEVEDLPNDFPRCATCTKPLHERVWFLNRYFDHCQRCTRHALIFNLPWPAHRAQDVLEYPPSHLIPPAYIPRKISSVPLPSLTKQVKKKIEEPEPQADLPLDRNQRRACKLRALFEQEDFVVDQLREAAWAVQDTKEQAKIALEEAKAEAKRLREEEKKRLDETRLKGSGVWSHYEYISAEELERRFQAKTVVLSGTRRGGRFRNEQEDDEMKKLAEEERKKEHEASMRRLFKPERTSTLAEAGDHQTVLPDRGGRQITEQPDTMHGNAVDNSAGPSRLALSDSHPTLTGIRSMQLPKQSPPGAIVPPNSLVFFDRASLAAARHRFYVGSPIGDHGRASQRGDGTQGTTASPSTEHNEASGTPSTTSSPAKRKRGRPRGTGKHQIAAAREAQAKTRRSQERVSSKSPRTNGYSPFSSVSPRRDRSAELSLDRSSQEIVDLTLSSPPGSPLAFGRNKGKGRADDPVIISDSEVESPPRDAPGGPAVSNNIPLLYDSAGLTPTSGLRETLITPKEVDVMPYLSNQGIYRPIPGALTLPFVAEQDKKSGKGREYGLPSVDDASPHGSVDSSTAGEIDDEEILERIVVSAERKVVNEKNDDKAQGEKRKRDSISDERLNKRKTFWVSSLGEPKNSGLARTW
ncbi:hypothetical protein BCR39DRAFT_533467 [Naematelia encephala]|uniref:SET domain-containing protein n=1 Tax=Naematelia encephala TaxID=71784 RepID=A0A1Y2B370_9TREE|nr:hypothetical protein BCR39DRAFT_533467 [Naematelia encephala]